MKTRYVDAIPLAPRPDLAQYKRLAKDLLAASRTPDHAGVGPWATSWIERLARLQDQTPTPDYVVRGSRELDRRRIDREVRQIMTDVESSRLVDDTARLADAQFVLARLHGFDSWPKFSAHVEALQMSGSSVSQFESAADAIVIGDIATLRRLLRENPALVHERSTRDHRATLLHYVAANGHEGFRQRTPKNAVQIARVLLEAGAEPDAQASMYDYQVTTMQMLVSSTHPHVAGVQVALVDLLVDFGARVNGVDDDDSPMLDAFRFHYPRAGEALARRGARIDTVIAAAALGRIDLVDEMIRDDGTLKHPPVASGPWPKLSTDPAQHLGYALTWAITFGHDDVALLMLEKGVDPMGRDDDGTALHAAAGYGRLRLMRPLIARGAQLEALNSYDGTVLSATLWFALNAPAEGVDYAVVVRELLALGARDDVYPEMRGRIRALLSK